MHTLKPQFLTVQLNTKNKLVYSTKHYGPEQLFSKQSGLTNL